MGCFKGQQEALAIRESLFGSSWCISSLLKFCKSTILGLSLVNLFLGVAL